MSLIEFDNVSYTYSEDEEKTLNNLSVNIEKGSFVAVLGRNGSGKSTFARHINGIFVPTEGKVTVCGYDTSDDSTIVNLRSHVGLVFQNPDNQIVSSIVEEDVAFAPENLGIEPEEIRRRVDESMKQVGIYEFRRHAPHLLSGGQKQRVAIAGALAMQPDILVLDEPTAMLDPIGHSEVLETVHRLNKEKGITVILITHHMEECIQADRVLILQKGAVAADGTPEEIFSDIEKMKGFGLDVPETVKVMAELKKIYPDLPGDTLSPQACAKSIKETIFNAHP